MTFGVLIGAVTCCRQLGIYQNSLLTDMSSLLLSFQRNGRSVTDGHVENSCSGEKARWRKGLNSLVNANARQAPPGAFFIGKIKIGGNVTATTE